MTARNRKQGLLFAFVLVVMNVGMIGTYLLGRSDQFHDIERRLEKMPSTLRDLMRDVIRDEDAEVTVFQAEFDGLNRLYLKELVFDESGNMEVNP